MATRNYFEKVYGPVGAVAGAILFVAGLAFTYFSLSGLVMAMLGALVGFSNTSAIIDFDKRRVKFSKNLFGIFPIGQWIPIQSDMKIGIRRMDRIWRSYSRSNRALDIARSHYFVMLYDASGNEILPIQKSDDLDSAKIDLDRLSKHLGIRAI